MRNTKCKVVYLHLSTSVMDIGTRRESFHRTFGVASLISTAARTSVRRHGRLLVAVKNVGQL